MEQGNPQNQLVYALRLYGLRTIAKSLFSWLISDTYVVSFRKSGRTWLRMLWARALQQQYGLRKINFDTQFSALGKVVPRVTFTHAGSTKVRNNVDFQRILRNKKIIFLARDPRDVVVSLYHDYTKRHGGYDKNISVFIRDKDYGFRRIVRFMNEWAETLKRREPEKVLMIRYEDLKKDDRQEFDRFLRFLGVSLSEEIKKEALSYATFGNMRQLEKNKVIDDPRLMATNADDLNSFKMRKGKVGSYKEELSADDICYLNEEIKRLDRLFGYEV